MQNELRNILRSMLFNKKIKKRNHYTHSVSSYPKKAFFKVDNLTKIVSDFNSSLSNSIKTCNGYIRNCRKIEKLDTTKNCEKIIKIQHDAIQKVNSIIAEYMTLYRCASRKSTKLSISEKIEDAKKYKNECIESIKKNEKEIINNISMHNKNDANRKEMIKRRKRLIAEKFLNNAMLKFELNLDIALVFENYITYIDLDHPTSSGCSIMLGYLLNEIYDEIKDLTNMQLIKQLIFSRS